MLKALYKQVIKISIYKNYSLSKSYIIYYIILIEISNDFKTRLFKKYIKNKQWVKILWVIKIVEETNILDRFKEVFLLIYDFIIKIRDSS